jgi:hypothetical protein
MKDIQLLTPYKLGDIMLSSRTVMAPMTRCRAIGNVPNELERAEADLVNRFQNNSPLSQDLKMDLFYTADEVGYTDYPKN